MATISTMMGLRVPEPDAQTVPPGGSQPPFADVIGTQKGLPVSRQPPRMAMRRPQLPLLLVSTNIPGPLLTGPALLPSSATLVPRTARKPLDSAPGAAISRCRSA